MTRGGLTFDSGLRLLAYLNRTMSRLHKDYEELFWISHMGDHRVDGRMNRAQAARDAFRGDEFLKGETLRLAKNSEGKIKKRLAVWTDFFCLYQTPAAAVPVKKSVAEMESRALAKRAKRREGYTDPLTKRFVEASENRMRTLLRTHPDEAVRKACFQSLEKLPLEAIRDYIEMVKGRNEFARALGYEDFYDYKLRIDEDMTKKELFSIFEKIFRKTRYAFKNVRKLEKTRPGLRRPWNFAYMMTGDFTKEEDPYFQFEDALSHWGRTFAGLGIDFQGGRLKLDLLDRKGKWNNGFCHYPDLVQYRGKVRIPGSSNFASNAIPRQLGSGLQGLETVFHEGGHAADRLNSLQSDVCVNHEYPPNTVSWAETQSMFMDTIAGSIEWRMRYAKNKAGQPYPFELFERKVRALHPLRPLNMMGLMYVVFFEKEIYECRNLTKNFVLKAARRAYRKYFDRSADSISVLNVPHIYSWESSAYYHGYGLAELAVAQWREYFFKKYGYIVDNRNVGKELTKIWSYASLYPAKKLIKMATGRKLSPQAYLSGATKSARKIFKYSRAMLKRLERVPSYDKPVRLNARIAMVHSKKKIADNRRSFEDMDAKYKAWLRSLD
ncbi:MAG: hypothetical protein QOG91_311 [Candidatus Parcubacteria bacterium]|nr:hypothetical protein [Candidatus Parcubacteria bacterium]